MKQKIKLFIRKFEFKMKKILAAFGLIFWLLSSQNLVQAAPQDRAPNFRSDKIFPTWGEDSESRDDARVAGVIGENNEAETVVDYFPHLVDIFLRLVAPFIAAMMIYTGARFVYSNKDEEAIEKSKKFFIYGTAGVVLIFMSYSLIKAIYLIMLV